MEWKTIRMKTVTPLFLHGQDPTSQPELRSPPFRGAMRYWLRAAMGAKIGDADPAPIKQVERAVFGDENKGSPILLRVQEMRKLRIEKAPLVAHIEADWNQSMAIAEDQDFNVLLGQRPGTPASVWEVACRAFTLAMTVGGIGQRSRRGSGALQIVGSTEKLIPPHPLAQGNTKAWGDYIDTIISNLLQALDVLLDETPEFAGIGRIPQPAQTELKYPGANQLAEVRLGKQAYDSAQRALYKYMELQEEKRGPRGKPELGGIVENTPHRHASPLWIRPLPIEIEQAGRQITKFGLLFVTVPNILNENFAPADYEAIKAYLDGFADPTREIPGWNR